MSAHQQDVDEEVEDKLIIAMIVSGMWILGLRPFVDVID